MAEIRDIKSGRSGEPPREPSPRRLAAIVAGDIAGYSRVMQIDDEGTHSRVKRIERDLIEPSIAEHNGRLVKTTGDGFIAIFDSPVEAVRCGIVIQQNIVGRNTSLPKHHWIEYRIGVNLGDVIIETDDVYGDGVNIASRLEGIADPGQVYISGGIYEQIKHKLVCGYESLGDRKIKNITDPVRVYRVLPDPAAFHKTRKRRENVLIFLLSLTLLVIAGGALWYLLLLPHGKVGNQASAPVSPPAEMPSAPSLPAPTVKPTAPPPQPAPSAAPIPQQAAPQPSSTPSVAPANQQAAQQPPPAPRATPGTPPASAVREPEMNTIRGGSFTMGSNDDVTEKPTHQVSIKPFAISRYPISVREWNECAAAKACAFTAPAQDEDPMTDLRRTQARYWWGDQFQSGMANCKNCADVAAAEQPIKVGSFTPNPFGLYDMGGGVDQWVEDCWHKNYQGAPSDGSPWVEGSCASHVIRSGSWKNDARYARPANRDSYDTNVRYPTHGFRVALSL